MKANTRNLFFLNVFLPILIGGSIYLLFRQDRLLMFNWFDGIGLNFGIKFIRSYSIAYVNLFPQWFLYCLPDALWLYAFVSFFSLIWAKKDGKYFYFWLSIGPIIAIGSEFGQLFRLISGTFDITDLIFYMLSPLFALFFVYRKKWKNYEFKKLST